MKTRWEGACWGCRAPAAEQPAQSLELHLQTRQVGMVLYACEPSTWEMHGESSEIRGHPGLCIKSETSLSYIGPYLKRGQEAGKMALLPGKTPAARPDNLT